VVATRTGLSRWPVGVGVDLLNGPDGAAYGVTASGNLVRVDAASGAAEGVGIELGAGASIFPTAVPGAIVARNGRGQLLRYDPSRETIDALTDVSSEAPLQVRLIGGDAIFVEHSQILAIAVSSD
jgi:hypothetical protein